MSQFHADSLKIDLNVVPDTTAVAQGSDPAPIRQFRSYCEFSHALAWDVNAYSDGFLQVVNSDEVKRSAYAKLPWWFLKLAKAGPSGYSGQSRRRGDSRPQPASHSIWFS
jgi:hypothetical protein